jgi:hypothetical protein
MHKLAWMLLIFIAACQSSPSGAPSRTVYAGEQSIAYYFQNNDASTWDTFSLDSDAAIFRTNDGTLEGAVVANRGYVWSLNNEQYQNVIVNVTLRQTQGARGASLGVLCRADDAGNGYYFLISSDGQYSISVATSAQNALTQLVPWRSSSAIKQGYQTNEIRAVCHDDYLAMFVNDVFVAETTDSQFSQGEIGLTLAAVGETAWAQFDNVLIRPTRG